MHSIIIKVSVNSRLDTVGALAHTYLFPQAEGGLGVPHLVFSPFGAN
jgi:hypothetical protein